MPEVIDFHHVKARQEQIEYQQKIYRRRILQLEARQLLTNQELAKLYEACDSLDNISLVTDSSKINGSTTEST